MSESMSESSTAPWLTATPYTSADIERYNRFTHFPKKAQTENERFAAAAMEQETQARRTLLRYGAIQSQDDSLPDDVTDALGRSRRAEYNWMMTHIRAREIAPPWSVVGPARYYEVARPKRAETMERRAYEACKQADLRLERVLGRYSPNVAISSDDADAPEKIATRIKHLQAYQDKMVAANKIFRKKMSEDEKLSALAELRIDSSVARKMMKGDFIGRIGYPDYELKNNNANIRRLKERLELLLQRRKRNTTTVRIEEAGATVVDSVEANRIQILFDGKPGAEIREQLKRNGFRWAPSVSAWQAYVHRTTWDWVIGYLRGLGAQAA